MVTVVMRMEMLRGGDEGVGGNGNSNSGGGGDGGYGDGGGEGGRRILNRKL